MIKFDELKVGQILYHVQPKSKTESWSFIKRFENHIVVLKSYIEQDSWPEMSSRTFYITKHRWNMTEGEDRLSFVESNLAEGKELGRLIIIVFEKEINYLDDYRAD